MINSLSVADDCSLHKMQNFAEIELRKNEIENASGGKEECVFRGLGWLLVGLSDRRKKATVIGG
nr:hypothetical protein BCU35_21930 [Vibrio lentus]